MGTGKRCPDQLELALPEEERLEYVFERLVAHKRLADGTVMLLVRWLGY